MTPANRTFDIILGTTASVVVLAFLGWIFWRLLKKSNDPQAIIIKLLITLPFVGACFLAATKLGPFGPFVIVFIAIVMSFVWTPHLGDWIARPLTGMFDGGDQAPEKRPLYSIARAKQKLGKYTEAIAEVRAQLAKFPNDFEGQMLIAEIQAEGQNDLPGAEITVQRLYHQKHHSPNQIIYALNSLADWHLKYAQDADAARQDLEKITELFPDSEFSLAATQRISHLDESNRVLLERHDHRKYVVGAGIENMGLLASAEHVKAVEMPPEHVAAAYVKQLEKHPLDMDTREKLAMLYASHYQRLDLAAGQLEQMIQTQGQPPKSVARWLNLLADFQTKLSGDYDAVRATLERIIAIAPDVAAAELARSRIAHLRLELKGQQPEGQSVKLGTYEQDIGLKNGPPR